MKLVPTSVRRWFGRQALGLATAALAPAADSPTGLPVPMGRVILSSARDRWLTASTTHYTPDRVEGVLRGAFSGDLTAQWELFDLMEATWPRLAKNLNELKQVLEDHDWSLQAWASEGDQPSDEALRRKRVVEHILWHFEPDPTLDENDFSDLGRDLADAWGKGLSIQELDWQPMPFEGGTVIGLKASRWIHPRYYGYPGETSGPDRLMLNLAEIQQGSGGATVPASGFALPASGQWAPFPRDKFLIGVAKAKTGHPIGAALLRSLAWWWAVSNFTHEWLVNLAQIFGVPIRWATYAQGTPAEQIAKIEDMLENMGSAAWGAFPAGTTLELKESLKAGTDNPQLALLALVDKLCDLVVLGQTLTSEQGERGSQALGRVHEGVLSGRKQALLKWAIKVLNAQLIPAICRLNFGDTGEAPYFVCGEDEGDDTKTKAETFKIVLESGAEIPKRFFYDELGIPQPEPGDEVIEPRAPTPAPVPGLPGQESDQPAVTQGRGSPRFTFALVQASDAQQRLAERIAEDTTGIERRWLGGAVPWFAKLVQAAQDPQVTDAEFARLLEAKAANLPEELAPLLNPESLAEAMRRHMGAAVVNGAVRGFLARNPAKRRAAA